MFEHFSCVFTHRFLETGSWLKWHIFPSDADKFRLSLYKLHTRLISRNFFLVKKTHTHSYCDRGETEIIYSRQKHTNVPHDHGGPHTENQDGPFMRPIQAAQTGPEAGGLRGMRQQKKGVSFHLRCKMVSNMLAFSLTATKATVSTHLISLRND